MTTEAAVLRMERAERMRREGEQAMADLAADTIATEAKTARLRALRLEKEAADQALAASAPPKTKARKSVSRARTPAAKAAG